MHKSPTSRNYRTLINVKNMDVCPIMEAVENFPMFRGYLLWFKQTFPGLVQKCPYTNFLVTNATYHIASNEEQQFIHINPNGMMRSAYFLYIDNCSSMKNKIHNNLHTLVFSANEIPWFGWYLDIRIEFHNGNKNGFQRAGILNFYFELILLILFII